VLTQINKKKEESAKKTKIVEVEFASEESE
jgi:hypothetical protein